jgi:hypothetical protein
MPYSDRYVAFIDILGFSDIIRKTAHDDNPARYNAILQVLTEIKSLGSGPGNAFEFQSFSDSIVLSSDVTADGLTSLVRAIEVLAIHMLVNGLLLRGGVAKGKLHHAQDVMFGPAFLDAYRIESQIAKYPRVVLSREVYQNFNTLPQKAGIPQVQLADDGPPYLDVLASLNDPARYASHRSTCQQMLQGLLDDSIHEPRHYEKLRWLAIYWNGTVALGDPVSRIELPLARAALRRAD